MFNDNDNDDDDMGPPPPASVSLVTRARTSDEMDTAEQRDARILFIVDIVEM